MTEQLMYEANKCPHYVDGGHRLVDLGRWNALYGDLLECSCGRQSLANTDETTARSNRDSHR